MYNCAIYDFTIVYNIKNFYLSMVYDEYKSYRLEYTVSVVPIKSP